LSGSAGCNNYNATYEVDGDNISIGPAAATRMFCPEPDGIIEQEVQYLAALETASTYLIEVDKMEMRTAEGALAATFRTAGD
jgi:heat shock protein HslJ